MSRRWIEANHSEFVRDVMRDYCMASSVLEAQFLRFEQSGTVSFPVMRDLLGAVTSKGLLWRLKDTAHHLLRNSSHQDPLALMLDWCLGYIFHECIKLKEDAYQHQHYAPQYKTLHGQLLAAELRAVVEPLEGVLAQTQESMRREISRIRYILSSCRKLFCLYCARHGDNTLLARLIHDRNQLIRETFSDEYANLLLALYGNRPELLHVHAATALMDGGRHQEALEALTQALAIAPECPEACALYAQLHMALPRRPF